ncbi:MAG: ABC transporter ATP-binding protein, partial [Actinobacteria bacterium]|nr:ABC transporter ATP-binding protein [Actinomycetota bacterium]
MSDQSDQSDQDDQTPTPTPTPKGKALEATERIEAPVAGPGRGPMGGGMVGQKAMDFGPSAKRMVARMRPDRVAALFVVALTVGSVLLMSIGPRILGHATDLVFSGFIGRQFPAGTPDSDLPDAVQGQDVIPGQGVDFGAVGEVLLLVLAIYVAASLLSWGAGYILNSVVQRTVYRMRQDVEVKINRLPLGYFDRSPRGELLSRVTNDIDNISTTLQQTMSQLLTSLMTVVAVLAMMLWISPLLALVALVSVPISLAATRAIMKRSQGQFVAQWRTTGRLNAHIEEAFSGHALVKVYGRRPEAQRVFDEQNEELYEASYGAQFVSGLIMPIMMFIGNLNYVVIAVLGGLRVASGAISLG